MEILFYSYQKTWRHSRKQHILDVSHVCVTVDVMDVHNKVVYYESIKRELKRRLIYEYRCDERLKTKNEESTRFADTGLVVIVPN